MSSASVCNSGLPWHADGDIRQYLAGPPGPPGPPGVPGNLDEELVDDVANRVLAYVQSKNESTTF